MIMKKIPKLWKDLQADSYFETFEDPVHSGCVDKIKFIDIYIEVLKTFDGSDMSSHVDFYFTSSVTNTTHLCFIDEDAKLDFFDYAVELGILPPLKEIQEGESKQEKESRKYDEEKFGRKEGQTKKSLKRVNVDRSEKEAKILEQKRKSLLNLQQKLDLETNVDKIKSLKKKIEKINNSM